MTREKKILMNYLLYILVFIGICIVGITGVFADTTVDTSQFFTVTGRKWSAGSLEFSSNPAFNNDWLLNAYNVTGGIYTPPNSYDYIEFSYFEHNTSAFNPCNSTGKFTAEFRLLFTSATFNQYVSSVKWGNDSCSIQERNQDGTMKVSCVASPSSNNYTDIFVYYNDIQGTATSSLYISRNIGITCGLNTDAIINNDNANTQNIINNNSQNAQDIMNNQDKNKDEIIDSQKVCVATKKESTKRYSTAYYSNPDNNIFANAGNTSWGWGETNTIGSVNTMSGTVKIVWEKISSSTVYGSPQFRLYTNEITQTESTPLTDSGSIILENVNNSTIKIAFKAGIGNRYKWEIYSEECINGNQVIAKQNEESEKTNKGILGKLKDLINYINPLSEDFFVYKLIELLGDLLKNLFVPSQQFLQNWYNDFKTWFENKLGFLATPILLFLDFIEMYLNLDETSNLIINIPEITVPNFENNVLIQAQTFNWGALLESKPAFQSLWNLYLDFIDVFLILNFLGLCEVTYNRIFGGNTQEYEYYTTEETYNINDETGEATNHQLRQRRTRREKVE